MITCQQAEVISIVLTMVLMYERGQFPIPYQAAIAIANVLEIDKNLLFDDFSQFLDALYSDMLRRVRGSYKLSQKDLLKNMDEFQHIGK